MNQKFSFLLILLCVSLQGMAQNSAISSTRNYLQYGELDKAKKSIDDAVQNEATIKDPKAWLYRGQVYEALYRTQDEKYKSLSADPISEVVISYNNSFTYDEKKKYKEDILTGTRNFSAGLAGLLGPVGNKGVGAYNRNQYDSAIVNFENYLKIQESMNKIKGSKEVDTSIIFYIGQAAYTIKKMDKAKSNFERLATEFNYKEPNIYLALSEIYKSENNTNAALLALDKGMLHASDKRNILIERLNIYMKQNNNEKAVEEGKKAIELDPKNISVYLAVGTMYQNMNKQKEADEIYQKAIAQEPNNFNANYLLGINYYNTGAEYYNKSIEIKDPKKSIIVENQAKEVWKKGLPYLEKAHSIDKKDPDAGKYLAELYAKLGDLNKAMEIKNEMKKK